jgi:hypothetical protein
MTDSTVDVLIPVVRKFSIILLEDLLVGKEYNGSSRAMGNLNMTLAVQLLVVNLPIFVLAVIPIDALLLEFLQYTLTLNAHHVM